MSATVPQSTTHLRGNRMVRPVHTFTQTETNAHGRQSTSTVVKFHAGSTVLAIRILQRAMDLQPDGDQPSPAYMWLVNACTHVRGNGERLNPAYRASVRWPEGVHAMSALPEKD